ncbi:MAG TPA: ATP-binding protein [Bryobacteraceae bacterium]|nr:ATP-binding protein [Bryobacteraceae bacterium]
MNLRSLPRSRPAIYGFALLCIALAGLVSWATGVILHIPAMLLPFTVAVAAAAWFGGLEGGLFATGVGTVSMFGLFRGIVFSMLAVRPGAPLLVTYCLIGAIVSLAIDRAVRDYTDLQRTKAELQRAIERLSETNKSLEQFARSASDALRTPLRAIGVFAELLLVRHATLLDNESKEYLRIMVSSVRDMNSAIDGLQEYARAKLPPPALLLIDSNSVLRQAMRSLESEILAAKATITFDELPTVRADEEGLLQVMHHLLANSLKYQNGAAPRVHLTAKREASEWIFSLADNGPCIDRKDAETIFDLFGRVDARTSDGRGIGLAICRATLERFGGRIWLESVPGEGSTFYFALPAGAATLNKTARA